MENLEGLFVFVRNFEFHVGDDVIADVQHRLNRYLHIALRGGTDDLVAQDLLSRVSPPNCLERLQHPVECGRCVSG